MTELFAVASFPGCQECARFWRGPAGVCLGCAAGQIRRPDPSACPVCAQRLTARGSCPNELCRSPRRRISKIHAIGYQTGALRRVIRTYKYGGVRTWATVLGRLVLGWLEQSLVADPPGLIVAHPTYVVPGVPGFAHTEAVLLAAAAADPAHRWRFDTATPAAIVKTRPTLKSADAEASAKRLSGSDLRSALRIPEPSRTKGLFVLVYDDICTTGTQLDAVAGCLLDQGGAARVEGLVLARAPWRGASSPRL